MLTRLRVTGFKNLVDIDVSFGPLTCIAGANGVGKSNLLDAIEFLSALASGTLIDAALSVRDQGAKTGDVRGLFHRVGERFGDEMTFEAEMIIPESGTDDLGQQARASSTLVQYAVSLRHKRDDGAGARGSLELIKEELKHIALGEAASHLPFPHSAAWKRGVVTNKRRTPKYISTDGDGGDRVIKVHQDGGSSGKPQTLRAANLPRTVLSAANAAESPTATLVKREMQSRRLLQLEPSSLREPDHFNSPVELASDGAHLPAFLSHLANAPGADPTAVYAEVANRVSDDVRSIYVDRDERRQLLTVYVKGRDGTAHPARALSDGTLRFLALAVLSMDSGSRGVICLEEPENGIHPQRIPAMIQLLLDLTTDPREQQSTGAGNPIRQVIINTHSPSVVMQVPEDSLILAEPVERTGNNMSFKALQLRSLSETWRVKAGLKQAVSMGQLLAYLNPVSVRPEDRQRRVVDRADLRQFKIPFSELAE